MTALEYRTSHDTDLTHWTDDEYETYFALAAAELPVSADTKPAPANYAPAA